MTSRSAPSSPLVALARRLAWSRVLPATVLFVVGATQPVLLAATADRIPRSLTLTAVVADGDDLIVDATPIQVIAGLLLLAVIGAFVMTLVAVENRGVLAGRVVIGFAAAVCVLVALFAAVSSNLEAIQPEEGSFVPAPSLLAAGLVPLFVGGVMAWLAVAGARDSRHLLDAGPLEP